MSLLAETAELSPRARAGYPRIPCLDGLRGLAILLILASHGKFVANFPNMAFLSMDGHGGIDGAPGVAFFFITTGFLIATLAMDEKERTGGIRLGALYVRRAVRLWPGLYVFLVAMALATWLGWIQLGSYPRPAGQPMPAMEWHAWINSALHIYNLRPEEAWVVHHTWSLSVQEQFYLVWPAVIALLRDRKMAWIAAGVILLWPMVRFFRHGFFFSPDPRAALDAPSMATILYGVLMAVWYRSDKLSRFASWAARGWVGMVAPPVLIWLLYRAADSWPRDLVFMITHLRSLLVLWWVWWCISNPGTWFGRFLESKALKTIGAMAFGIYIWQQPFLGLNTGWITFFPQNLVATFALAAASHYFIEMPFARLKCFDWARSRRGQTAAAPAPEAQVAVPGPDGLPR